VDFSLFLASVTAVSHLSEPQFSGVIPLVVISWYT